MDIWALFEVFPDGDGNIVTDLLSVWGTLDDAKEAAIQQEQEFDKKYSRLYYPPSGLFVIGNKFEQCSKRTCIGNRSDFEIYFRDNLAIDRFFLIEKLTMSIGSGN